jgi:hypothetical protein
MRVDNREFEDLVFQLIETLHQELHQHRRLLDVVHRKKQSFVSGRLDLLRGLHDVEKEVLADLVTVQRDRISLLAELGQILGHPSPSRLRIAELIGHASPEGRDELLDLRDDFRDLADELEGLAYVEALFSRHHVGQIRLYVAPPRMDAAPAAREGYAHSRNVERSEVKRPKGSVASPGEHAA